MATPGTADTPRRFVRALFDATEGYEGDEKIVTPFRPNPRRTGLPHQPGRRGTDSVLFAVRAPLAAVLWTCAHRIHRARAHPRVVETDATCQAVRKALFGTGAHRTAARRRTRTNPATAWRCRARRGRTPLHADAWRPRERLECDDFGNVFRSSSFSQSRFLHPLTIRRRVDDVRDDGIDADSRTPKFKCQYFGELHQGCFRDSVSRCTRVPAIAGLEPTFTIAPPPAFTSIAPRRGRTTKRFRGSGSS